MRRLILWLATTATTVVLALSYHTSSPGASASATTVAAAPEVAGSTATGSAPSAASGSSATLSDGSYTGKVVSTRYGPVQVRITVTNGTLTSATAVQYPSSNGKDRQINGYAIPKLNAAATAAHSADIHTVSGATYTSGGYVTSLQSAIDQAKL